MKKLHLHSGFILLFIFMNFSAKATHIFDMEGLANSDTLSIILCSDEDFKIVAPSNCTSYAWYGNSITPAEQITVGIQYLGYILESDTCLRGALMPISATSFRFVCQNSTGGSDTIYIGIMYENMALSGLDTIDAGMDRTMCNSDQIDIYPAYVSSGLTIKWDPDQFADTLSIDSGGDYIVYGCRSGLILFNAPNSCCTRDTIHVEGIAGPLLEAGPDDTICRNTSLMLTASGYGPSDSIYWDNGVIDSQYFQPSTTTLYTVTAIASDSMQCSSSDSVKVVVLDTIITEVFALDTINSTLIAAPGYSYQWLDCNMNMSPIAGETNQSISLIEGDFAVELSNGTCKDTSDCFSQMIQGIRKGEDFDLDLEIWPNPSSGMVNVRLESTEHSVHRIQVFNAVGAMISSETIVTNEHVQINLSDSPSGLYLLKVIGDTHSISRQWIKK